MSWWIGCWPRIPPLDLLPCERWRWRSQPERMEKILLMQADRLRKLASRLIHNEGL
jgi:hypothetical protein